MAKGRGHKQTGGATLPLDKSHLKEFHKGSGIPLAMIRKAKVRTVTATEITKILRWQPKDRTWGRGWFVPFDRGYGQVKLDTPRLNRDCEPIKYESPVDVPVRAYFPPGFDRAATEWLITEGVKKALAAQAAGFDCIALIGVWNWQKRRERDVRGRPKGERQLIGDLDNLPWNGRRVLIAYDSDAAQKRSVRLAEFHLAEKLTARGAEVRTVRLPAGPNGEKVGLDDFLVMHGKDGPAKLRELLGKAEAIEKAKWGPLDWARLFGGEYWMRGNDLTLRYWQDDWYEWAGTHYARLDGDSHAKLADDVLRWLSDTVRHEKATPHYAQEIIKALRAICRVPADAEPPCLLPDTPDGNVGRFEDGLITVSCTNGVLHVDLRALKPAPPPLPGGKLNTAVRVAVTQTRYVDFHTPRWFDTSARDFPYRPSADCPRWRQFLNEVMDAGSQELVQRWFGDLLRFRLSHQEVLLLVGPPRSGKGLTLRVMEQIAGLDVCTHPRLFELGKQFGLADVVGARLAIIGDAHITRHADAKAIAELIKMLSGRDRLNVDRKHKTALRSVRLDTRLVIACNELPTLPDSSGALPYRLRIIEYPNSFVGREDKQLEGKLLAELPGILNWSIEGLAKLLAAGEQFNQPASGQEAIDDMLKLSAPILSFIEDVCDRGPKLRDSTAHLYDAYRLWCVDTGHQPVGRNKFGAQLRRVRGLKSLRPSVGQRRFYAYTGIAVRKDVFDGLSNKYGRSFRRFGSAI